MSIDPHASQSDTPALKVKKSEARPVKVTRSKPAKPARKWQQRRPAKKMSIAGKNRYRALVENDQHRLQEADAGMNPRRGLFALLGIFIVTAFVTVLIIARQTPTPDVLVIARGLREAGIAYTASDVYVSDDLQLKFYAVDTLDLTPLRPLPIQALILKNRQTADLTPLQGMALRCLVVNDTQVSDLSPLKGMPLEFLDLRGTPVSDLSPLDGMPLVNIGFSESTVTQGVAVLRRIPSLKLINKKTPARFWADYDNARRPPRASWRDTLEKLNDTDPLDPEPMADPAAL